MRFVLNHMTTARKGFIECLDIASSLGCEGVELRNDLAEPLFGGLEPAQAKDLAESRQLNIFALAEVKNFNLPGALQTETVDQLITQAVAAGVPAVSLIPANNHEFDHADSARDALTASLIQLKPRLDAAGLLGLIEPLGFASSTVRLKSAVVEVLNTIGGTDTFKLIHDTFHHTLASEPFVYADHTAMVHVSGVVDPSLSIADMQDSHRVLVDTADQLGNITQLSQLMAAGYTGPVSFEAFAAEIHALDDPTAELAKSMSFIRSGVTSVTQRQ